MTTDHRSREARQKASSPRGAIPTGPMSSLAGDSLDTLGDRVASRNDSTDVQRMRENVRERQSSITIALAYIATLSMGAAQMRVLTFLVSKSDSRTGKSWWSHPAMSAAIGLDERRVRRVIGVLRKRGLVHVRLAEVNEKLSPAMKYELRGRRNVYSLLVPPWKTEPASTGSVETRAVDTRAEESEIQGSLSPARVGLNQPSPPPYGSVITDRSQGSSSSPDHRSQTSSRPRPRARGPEAIGAPPDEPDGGAGGPEGPPLTSTSSPANPLERAGNEVDLSDREAPNVKNLDEGESLGRKGSGRAARRDDARELVALHRAELWPDEAGRPFRASRADLELVIDRLVEGFTPEDLRDAIQGAKVSEYNTQKPTQRTLRSIFGSAEAVETLGAIGRFGGRKRPRVGAAGSGRPPSTNPPPNGQEEPPLSTEQMARMGADLVASLDSTPTPRRPR